MKIINNDKFCNNIDNGLSNIVCKCGCCFSASESDIEVQVIPVPYEKGIKKHSVWQKDLFTTDILLVLVVSEK